MVCFEQGEFARLSSLQAPERDPSVADKTIAVRPAIAADVPLILTLIRDLADYERLSHEVVATEERIARDLFGSRPYAEALIGTVDDEPAGFALFFHNYSTFVGAPGMYLEDLFVRPAFRELGLGKLLISEVGRFAVERGCARYEWSVLDWNEPAIRFYKSLGAQMFPDWRRMRVEGEALRRFETQ
jgi:GNAT superfamily N-acetyltransferase